MVLDDFASFSSLRIPIISAEDVEVMQCLWIDKISFLILSLSLTTAAAAAACPW